MRTLHDKSRWLCWHIEEVDGSHKKTPIDPRSKTFAACDNPATWCDYPTAQAAVDNVALHSVGFALGKEVGLVVVDLDKVVAKPGDEWPQWALDIIEDLDSYTEVSASGRGFHILVWGSIPSNLNKQGLHIEMWDSNKMFAFTGTIFQDRNTIQARQAQLSQLHARTLAGKVGPDYKPSFIVERYDSPKFRDCCADNWQAHFDSRSAAVHSVLCTLAQKYDYDADKMRADFEETPLRAAWFNSSGDKWPRLGDREIKRAVEYMQTKAASEPPVEPVPAFVDLDAELPSQEIIPPFPSAAMYGRAGELAQSLDCPLGYAYLAVLTAAAGRYKIVSNGTTTRGTLYTALMGRVHHGKSVTQDRAEQLFGNSWAITKTPASDKGLQRMFPTLKEDSKFVITGASESRLLMIDELREMMTKAAIENSTLASMLCTLWSKDRAGNIAKDGPSHEVEARLSILGALKIARPSEFPQVFSFATSQGLYDRFLFAVRDVDDHWFYRDKLVTPVPGDFAPSAPVISPECDLALRDWKQGNDDRGRLGELAKRVALISGALNGDAEITPTSSSFRHAIALMEYQESIRSVYQPSQGQDPYQECVEAILSAFKAAKGAANWRQLSQRHNWHRRFPKVLRQVKSLLEQNGDLCLDKATGKHYVTSRV